jgi:Trypsin
VFGGKPVDIKEVPWQVALYTFREEKLRFQCGGALISTRFILTGKFRFHASKNAHLYFIIAAHCIFGRDGAAIPTSELIIFLGKTRTDGEWTNDGGVKAKAVIDFISRVKLS